MLAQWTALGMPESSVVMDGVQLREAAAGAQKYWPEEGDPGPFVQRDDDTEEAIQNRLDNYHEQTEPLKEYYEEQGILVTVDASKDIEEVTEQVLKAVGEDK